MSPEKAEELLSHLLRYEQLLLELKNKNVGGSPDQQTTETTHPTTLVNSRGVQVI